MICRHNIVTLLVCLLAAIPSVFSQSITQTLRGTIIDAESGAQLPGATVFVLNSDPPMGAISDEDGNFRIEQVPVGRLTLIATLTSYEDLTMAELFLSSGKELVLTVKMTESIVETELETVEIQGGPENNDPLNEMATVSARSFTIEQSGRFAASGFDPARLALSFGGVNLTNDLTNEIVIRGNAPDGLLWRLEGIEIPNPNHLSGFGAAGGGVSMFSNNILGASDFYTGAFPGEFGNALSGVFDLNLKKGNNESHEFTVQLGTVGLEASAEGPLGKKGGASYLVNYRYSSLDLMERAGYPLLGDLSISFQDLAFKVRIPSKKAGILSLWSVMGMSDSKKAAFADTTEWDEYKDQQEWRYYSKYAVSGITHEYLFNAKTSIKTTIAGTATDYLGYQWQYLNTNLDQYSNWNNIVKDISARGNLQLNHKFNARHSLRAGVFVSYLNFKYLDSYDISESLYMKRDSGSSFLNQAYAQWKFRVTSAFTLNTGVHITHFAANKQVSVEPRMGFKWQPHQRHVFSMGIGMHSKIEPLFTYLYDFSGEKINQNLRLGKAVHAVLGYRVSPAKNLTLKAEAYYQHLYKIPTGEGTNGLWSSSNGDQWLFFWTMTNEGKARNYGIELTLEKHFARNWYFLVNGSIYESEFQLTTGEWLDSRYNGKFIFNITGGKDIVLGKNKNHILGVNGRMIWAGGLRTIPINLSESISAGEEVLDYFEGYADQQDNYFRFDVRLSYKMNLNKFCWSFSVDAQNVTNRLNELSRYYDPVDQDIKKYVQTGLIPMAMLRFEF